MPSYRISKHPEIPRDQRNTRNGKESILKVTYIFCEALQVILKQVSSLPWPQTCSWTQNSQVATLQPELRESRREDNTVTL